MGTDWTDVIEYCHTSFTIKVNFKFLTNMIAIQQSVLVIESQDGLMSGKTHLVELLIPEIVSMQPFKATLIIS